MRQPEILVGLGKKRFFFRYNEDRAEFEDLSLLIRANLIKHLGLDKNSQIPKLNLSVSDDSIYVSQPLNIPAYLIGGIEIRMRLRNMNYQDIGSVCWYRSGAEKPICRSFFIDLDGEFHTCRIPFTIYRPDLTGDVYITKIEVSLPSISSEVDIEYIRLFPYQR